MYNNDIIFADLEKKQSHHVVIVQIAAVLLYSPGLASELPWPARTKMDTFFFTGLFGQKNVWVKLALRIFLYINEN